MSNKQTASDKPVSSADAAAALDGTPTNSTQPQAQPQGPDLTVSDLNALKSIIDVASSRGTFRPNEMMTVGQVYNKLEAFLNAVSAQQGNG
jgi:hypothetical protein